MVVSEGKTIDSAETPSYTLTLTATPGGSSVTSAVGSATLTVTIGAACDGAAQLVSLVSVIILAVVASVNV